MTARATTTWGFLYYENPGVARRLADPFSAGCNEGSQKARLYSPPLLVFCCFNTFGTTNHEAEGRVYPRLSPWDGSVSFQETHKSGRFCPTRRLTLAP